MEIADGGKSAAGLPRLSIRLEGSLTLLFMEKAKLYEIATPKLP